MTVHTFTGELVMDCSSVSQMNTRRLQVTIQPGMKPGAAPGRDEEELRKLVARTITGNLA
jgi:hypothetical protein